MWSKGKYRFADSVPAQRERKRQLDLADPRLLQDRPPPQPDIFKALDELRKADTRAELEPQIENSSY